MMAHQAYQHFGSTGSTSGIPGFSHEGGGRAVVGVGGLQVRIRSRRLFLSTARGPSLAWLIVVDIIRT